MSKKLKITVMGIIALIINSFVFLALENYFFTGLSDDGVLQESLFLPLGMLSFVLAAFLLFVISCNFVIRKLSKKRT